MKAENEIIILYLCGKQIRQKKTQEIKMSYDRYDHRAAQGHNYIHKGDVATWGYIILYIVVMLSSLAGNSLFLLTIKRNLHLRRTHHFFLAAMSMRDLIVTIMVIPFAIAMVSKTNMYFTMDI